MVVASPPPFEKRVAVDESPPPPALPADSDGDDAGEPPAAPPAEDSDGDDAGEPPAAPAPPPAKTNNVDAMKNRKLDRLERLREVQRAAEESGEPLPPAVEMALKKLEVRGDAHVDPSVDP